MFHVARHVMKLHDCISYARSHHVESGVGAWYWLFTKNDECIVSLEIGTTSKIETHGCIKIIIINFVCLGEAKWGRSPQGERPKFYSWSDISIQR